MSQAGKLYSGGSGVNTLTTTVVAETGQAQAINSILNAFGGSNINTSVPSDHTVQVNLDDNIVINSATIGNIHIEDDIISSLNTNGDISLVTSGSGKVAYSNPSLNSSSFLYFDNDLKLQTTTSATDGQLLIGVSGGSPVVANLTAGDNVFITNGPNNITISASSGGIGGTGVNGWITINRDNYPQASLTYEMKVNTGYIIDWYTLTSMNPYVLTLTFPPVNTLQIGDTVSLIIKGGYGSYSTDYSGGTSFPPNVLINPQINGGYGIIAPYQSVGIVTQPVRPVTYGTGGASARPSITMSYTGTDINLNGTNQPIWQVIQVMGSWKF